jgi:hypothetical protein
MDKHAELEHLLADLLDGPPDASRNQRLDELLRTHPDLHGDYLDYMQLHALLQWRGGNVQAAGPAPTPEVETQRTPVTVTAGASRWMSRRGLAAAVVFLAACVAAIFLLRPSESQATPDPFVRLCEWNLELAEAHTPGERNRIYDEQAANLKATLAKAELTLEDREIAETLLANGAFLINNDDPIAEADRFNDIADKLVARIDAAAAAHDEDRIAQLADIYQRVTEVGVDANLERAFQAGAIDNDQKQKMSRTFRSHRLAEIMKHNPEAHRKAMRRGMTKGHKTKKAQKATD